MRKIIGTTLSILGMIGWGIIILVGHPKQPLTFLGAILMWPVFYFAIYGVREWVNKK